MTQKSPLVSLSNVQPVFTISPSQWEPSLRTASRSDPAVMRENVDDSSTFFFVLQDTLIRFRVRGTKLEKMDGFQFSDISYLAIRKTLDPFSQ